MATASQMWLKHRPQADDANEKFTLLKNYAEKETAWIELSCQKSPAENRRAELLHHEHQRHRQYIRTHDAVITRSNRVSGLILAQNAKHDPKVYFNCILPSEKPKVAMGSTPTWP